MSKTDQSTQTQSDEKYRTANGNCYNRSYMQRYYKTHKDEILSKQKERKDQLNADKPVKPENKPYIPKKRGRKPLTAVSTDN